MDVILHPRGEEPLYKQLYRQIVSQIASEKLAENEPLPSIRTAARYLNVAIVTVKTAYEELSKDGYVTAQPAKGFYVAEGALALCRSARTEAEKACEEFLSVCRKKGLTDDEIVDLVDTTIRR